MNSTKFRFKSGKFKAGALREAGLSGKTHMIPCPGEAHRPEAFGMIDNCSWCAPRWGELELPVEHADVAAWRSFYLANGQS